MFSQDQSVNISVATVKALYAWYKTTPDERGQKLESEVEFRKLILADEVVTRISEGNDLRFSSRYAHEAFVARIAK